MFEVLGIIGSVLLTFHCILQFCRTYKNREVLKDFSLPAWILAFISVTCMFVRLVEIGEYAMAGMEAMFAITNLLTVVWIIKSK